MSAPPQVLELILDNCRSADGHLEGLTSDFCELESLSLVNVALGSLARVPSLPKLRKVRRRGPRRCTRLCWASGSALGSVLSPSWT